MDCPKELCLRCAIISLWIRLRLPYCSPGFESQAQLLCFFNLYSNSDEKWTKNIKNRPALAHCFKKESILVRLCNEDERGQKVYLVNMRGKLQYNYKVTQEIESVNVVGTKLGILKEGLYARECENSNWQIKLSITLTNGRAVPTERIH